MLSIAPVRSAVSASRRSYVDVLEEAWQQHLAPREEDAPTVISTFAGCGGSSLGYSMAGYRELLAVEWDNNAVETFRLNFPGVDVYHGDIAKLSVGEVLARTGLEPGELDVLDGSPPCQGFSTAGKRDFGDERNQLFREYIRLLRGLQPRCFIMENVSGMIKGKMKLIFAEILRELKASGYRVSARLMNAMYFNVPQSRERMIFVGVREDLGLEPSHPRGWGKPLTVGAAFYGMKPSDTEPLSPLYQGYWQRAKPGDAMGRSFGDWKMNPNRAANVIRKKVSCLAHWAEPRWLALNEFATVASFPPGYRWVDKQSAVQRMGNSVPPLFMHSLALHLRAAGLSVARREEGNSLA